MGGQPRPATNWSGISECHLAHPTRSFSNYQAGNVILLPIPTDFSWSAASYLTGFLRDINFEPASTMEILAQWVCLLWAHLVYRFPFFNGSMPPPGGPGQSFYSHLRQWHELRSSCHFQTCIKIIVQFIIFNNFNHDYGFSIDGYSPAFISFSDSRCVIYPLLTPCLEISDHSTWGQRTSFSRFYPRAY